MFRKFRSIRFLFLSSSTLFLLLLGGRELLHIIYYVKADRFSHSHIQSHMTYDPQWDISCSQEEKQNLSPLLDQPFFYLGKGSQCFVFESQDGSCVLKFFRHERYRIPAWVAHLKLPQFLAKLQAEQVCSKEKKRENLFQSCLLAFQELRHESGILLLHLNKGDDLQKTVTLYDKVGRRLDIPIDHYEFLLQKKATLVYPSFEKWIQNGEIEKAKEAVTAFIALLEKRFQKGIADHDPVLSKNAGFLEMTPVYIDTGQFEKQKGLQNAHFPYKEIEQIMKNFRQWLQEHDSAELVLHLDETIEKLRDHTF